MAVTTTTPTAATTSATAATSSVVNQSTIAGNFDTFLKLLTTQLQNQNPLDPLDTNQFTQQLVQFAQVEQQINMNSSLGTLISLQQASQATQAVSLLGTNVTVGGGTAALSNGQAKWSFTSPSSGTATVTIKDSTGQTVYSGTTPVQSGAQTYTWNGVGTNGAVMANGNYTISITAKDSSGQAIAVSTDATGTVDNIDVTQTPPVLTIGGQQYPLTQIKQVNRTGVF
jgi:flagellar basal-body rod modification protein FlgD